jgi:hypothetical protein
VQLLRGDTAGGCGLKCPALLDSSDDDSVLKSNIGKKQAVAPREFSRLPENHLPIGKNILT